MFVVVLKESKNLKDYEHEELQLEFEQKLEWDVNVKNWNEKGEKKVKTQSHDAKNHLLFTWSK